jgi:two-component system sensor histidine kinase DesK
MVAAALDTAPADEGGPVVRQPGRYGWVFSCIWLVYLWYPLAAALEDPSPFWRALAVVAVLAFAGSFAWFFVSWRARRLRGRPISDGRVLAGFTVGVLLMALAAPAAHDAVLAGSVYLAVIGMMSLPLRRGLTVVAVLVVAILVLPRVLPHWTNEDQLVFSLLLGSFAAFGVGQVIARNSELLRAREQLVELAVARERARLARDVHDILGHSLTVITVKTELAGRLLDSLGPDPRLDRVRAEVAEVEALARVALADVRATAAGTRTVSLPGELAAARQALESAGIAADLPIATDEVPAEHRELFAWVVREGVTNVVRHSGARWCGVRLDAGCVEVRDDGRGDCPADGGTGLTGLRGRAESAGCRLETGRSPEGGFLLRVRAA